MDAIYYHTYPFTAIQTRINKQTQKNEVTMHTRACMMAIADKVAKRNKLVCLVTGESLSQVWALGVLLPPAGL
jgi:thiamine biosynthesis protein ThiI